MKQSLFFLFLFTAAFSTPALTTSPPVVFPISTEMQIGKIKTMVEKAPKGAYVTVGGERGFRGASLVENADYLFLLDISDEIVRFNQINKKLLRAPDREQYRHLRWEADYSAWQELTESLTEEDFKWWVEHIRNLEQYHYPLPEALNKLGYYPYVRQFLNVRDSLTAFYKAWDKKSSPKLSEQKFIETISFEKLQTLSKQFNIALPITADEWSWWVKYGRNRSMYCPAIWLQHPEEAVELEKVIDYKQGNYLFDDALYEKIHKLAIKNRINIIKIDLGDAAALADLLKVFTEKDITISVLDLNNLYHQDYLGEKKYQELLPKFLPYGKDNSIILVMNNYKDYACAQFQIYLGFTFKNASNWPSYFLMQSFFDTLPKPLLDIMDGKVYDEGEMPPLRYIVKN